MLLRKLKLDWRYGVGELVIVISGVMIALYADGRIQDRGERTLEIEYVESLAIDLNADVAELTSTISLAAERAQLGHRVLQAMAGDTVLDPAYLATAVERVMYFTYPAYSRSTISDLMSTGNLRILQDPGLKRTLSDYYQAIDRAEQWTGNWREIQMDLEHFLAELLDLEHREALVSTGAPTVGSPLDYTRLSWAPEFAVTELQAQEILNRLRANPEIRPRIEGMIRIQDSQYGSLTRLRRQAENTLRVVEASGR